MNTNILLVAAFVSGVGLGWLGKTWLQPVQSPLIVATSGGSQATTTGSDDAAINSAQALEPTPSTSQGSSSGVNATPNPFAQNNNLPIQENASGTLVTDNFNQLLRARRYRDAMNLYQEQKQQNNQITTRWRIEILDQMKRLKANRNNSDFSALVDNYLSIYYEDIDVLLLLADFNQSNGSYLETVDVYLLADTYAYTDINQKTVSGRLNRFVEEIDNLYTSRQDWWSLINFYSHINSSGLMTSLHRYRQALAYLKSGDEAFAIEQLTQLLNDSLVGDAAAIALNNLANNKPTTPITERSSRSDSVSIALEKIGNQFAVNLNSNREESVKLLLDTGASMTALSSASFTVLNASGDAIEQERRVFRTAGGVVMGTVYSFPELRLGPYSMDNVQVAVIDFDTDRKFDGLLGMNILGQFRFQIDQENSRLLLSEKI